MSLEKTLQENTEATKALTVALGEFLTNAGVKAEKVAPKEEKTAPAPKKEAKVEKSAPKEEKGATGGIPYDDVKNKTLELVKAKGRDIVMSLLEDFGKDVKSAKDLEEGQYAEYLERVNGLLNEDDMA